MNKNIKFAEQGVHQSGIPVWETIVLKAGDTFTTKENEILTIPVGAVGIVHLGIPSSETTISVIRDDCKAARKALKKDKVSITPP